MAQGDAFELGVAVRVKNPHFRHGSWYEDQLTIAVDTGKIIQMKNAANELQSIAIGDRLVIGPSTNITDAGKTESGVVLIIADRTGNNTNVTLEDNLSYDYEANDPVTGYGTNLGGTWSVGTTAAVPGGITTARGMVDRYSQKIGLLAPADEIRQMLDDDDFETSTLYRAGMYYKQRAAAPYGTAEFYLQVYDGNDTFINKICDDTSDIWVAVTDTGTCHSAVSGSYLRLFYKGASTFYADCMFLEHDSGQVIPAGFYTFTEYPDLGSLTWGTRNQFKEHELLDGALKKYSLSYLGDNGDKYVLKAHFSWVSQTFWDALVKFQEWQKRGRLLNLHPHIDDLPPILTGYMKIGKKRKDLWNLATRSFEFTFIEA